ncbi:hypothetical protein GCM10010124_00210 [Pilimelia terevasa]|uniref:Uncharacterized protein n=1 Tax=Pilimelia terevasa TaxID=53372 RepID=A0A8J3FDU9_9ACTN|nr:hypothetical protein GCM10010124_00210 [Pilimelia terevasa]
MPSHTPPPYPPPEVPPSRKDPTVRIRLHGTPADIAAALPVLAEVLDIHTVSRTYTDRTTSTHARVYLDAEPRPTREDR